MVENIVVTKQGSESSDPNRTLFDSTTSWQLGGSNLIVYKNGILQEKNSDYSVISQSSIQLSAPASTTDRISMVITQFLDPGGLTTIDQRMIDVDRATKRLEGKSQTSIQKREYEETIPSSLIIHSDEIWASNIPENPTQAETQGVAFKRFNFTLTEDLTVQNKKGWYSSINGQLSGRIINWIPPKFGRFYNIRLYDNSGVEIPSASSIRWRWDYQSGYLFISESHNHTTPFRISGYIYTGSVGTGHLMYWKPPVYSFSVLPLYNNQDGDVRFVTSENRFYRWNNIVAKWESAQYGSARFKDPVLNYSNLPITSNVDGDIRLVLSENALYRWNAASSIWDVITGNVQVGSNYYTKAEIDIILENKSDVSHNHDTMYYRKLEVDAKVRWRPSRATQVDLPPYTENLDGDIILTRDNNTIWRWYSSDPNTGQGYWAPILTSNYYWLAPVDTHTDLPQYNNHPGHVRLVLDEGIAYWWDGTTWINLTANSDTHSHDDQYYTKDEIYWLVPVNTFADLPITNNKNGDVRLTLNNNNTYKWNNVENKWELFSAAVNWREHVDYIANLPIIGNRNRDIRFVNYEESFYYWDDATSTWKPARSGPHNHNDLYYLKNEVDQRFDIYSGHNHDGINSKNVDYNNLLNIPHFYWKNPVVFVSDLLSTGNNLGDARIVLNNRSIYCWTGSQWELITGGGTFVDHDHDDRYYTETEIDQIISLLIAQFNAQLALKSDINHHHDVRYYTKSYIDQLFNTISGHDHDGINSKKISYYNLKDVPDFSQTHDHDGRYYTIVQLQQSGMSQVHWDNITNKPSFGGTWKTPVQAVGDLPSSGNDVGDIRLVLDDSDVYEWDGTQWNFVGHWVLPGPDYWEAPVNTYGDLPSGGNQDGDVRLVKDVNILYRWDSLREEWVNVGCCPESTGSFLDVQVYLNGMNLKENEEWKIQNPYIQLLVSVQNGDRVTILVIRDQYFRKYEFEITSALETSFLVLGTMYFRQDFVASAGQTLFQLDTTYPMGQNYLLVWLNGILIKIQEDYIEISNNSFQILEPLEDGDRVISVLLGYNIGNGSYIREDHVATLGQQYFTLNNICRIGVDQLLVYLNGLLQKEGVDYNQVSNIVVGFFDPTQLNDFVSFVILKDFGASSSSVIIDACSVNLGIPSDGSWTDGLLPFHELYRTCDAIDDINEVLRDIVPAPPESLLGKSLQTSLNFYSGYTSVGNINYETFAGDFHSYLIEQGNFYIYTPDDSFSDSDKGILKLIINGSQVDEFDLYNAFVESNRSEQQGTSYGVQSLGARGNEGITGTSSALRDSDNGYISIMSVGSFSGFSLWQKGKARINLTFHSLRKGYNYLQLIHDVNAQMRTTTILKFFYDNSGSKPDISEDMSFINELELNSSKYVSGIRYYSISDKFTSYVLIQGLYSNTFIEYPVILNLTGMNDKEIAYNDSDIVGIQDPPDIDDLFEITTNLTLNKWNEYSVNARLKMIALDPFGPEQIENTSSQNRLINTYTNGSTDLIEYFRDEVYRLPSADYNSPILTRTGNWNSQDLLINGSALLYDKKLKYPSINFTSGYKPIQSANYSGFTGPQTYYRTFYKNNTPRNSGILVLRGITINNLLTNKIYIDIKLPTVTGWLSLNEHFDETQFDGVDGDGCFIQMTDNDEFHYSTGTLSTAHSSYQVIIRITLPDNSTPELTYIEMKWS